MQQTTTTRQKYFNRDLYFTDDHEWIDFQGSVAYTGICTFKLKGIRNIEKIGFAERIGAYQENDVIGSIYYGDYKIDIHMPVDGRILSFNEELIKGNTNLLLTQPESRGWFALITPIMPYDRKGLMISEKYQMRTNNRF